MRRFACSSILALGVVFAARDASAGPFDLEDEEDEPKKASSDAATPPLVDPSQMPTPPVQTIRTHAYTLAECLLLAERNAPQIWAAKGRLGRAQGQYHEAIWQPWSFWHLNSTFGYLPPIGGTPFYNASPYTLLYQGFGSGWQPAFGVSIGGTLPLYTFGKIDSIKRAAEGNVRVQEWDIEKQRQQIRADTRRAFYGLMLARDAQYIANDVLGKLNKAIGDITRKLERGDQSVEEADRLRLEYNRDEILARMAEARKGEAYATAGLRFLTGVQSAFDIPDEPLKRPNVVIGPVVRYLTAARLFRADVNMARAGVAARKAFVDFRRAELFPNIGVGFNAAYSVAPSADPQRAAWIGDPFNRFGASFGFGVQWGLDFLPKQARIEIAEAELEETRALERLALGGVAVEVENAYAAVVEANTREMNWDRAEHRSKRWIAMTQDAIDLGTKDERFLIEPLRAFIFARISHATALMDLNVNLSELARVTGWDAAAGQ
ncbi:MAG: TolC family protein [Labilithrix sp.]|nr:TolC family protein [Labilithrix sp.]MCW5816896.1 TolC family protein [Labilithrix sp.]